MSGGLQGAGRREAPVIGITGNIGTGKSTVTEFLAALGVHVVDADQVVHRLYRDPHSALVQAVAAEFGGRVLAADGTLDRAALGRVVFNDAADLKKLEGNRASRGGWPRCRRNLTGLLGMFQSPSRPSS